MENRPLYENLDTSFVNLAGLIKYLRRRQIGAHIRLELIGYEADIFVSAEKSIEARESEPGAAAVEGEEALRRILLRAREPGGIINVYQQALVHDFRPSQATGSEKTPAPKIMPSEDATPSAQLSRHGAPPRRESAPFFPKPLLDSAKLALELNGKIAAPPSARRNLSPDEWETLLEIMGELLGAIDAALSQANLNFSAAFQKARAEVAADYPFLPSLSYERGRLATPVRRNAEIFVAGILEAVRLVLDRLARNPDFAEAYRSATQKILALAHRQSALHEKFLIAPPLRKILGI